MVVPSSSAIVNILGPLIAAVMFNTFLYGLCVLQFITYCTSGYKDRAEIRLLVYWELFVNTCHSAIIVYMLWLYAVEHFMDEVFLPTAPWPLIVNGFFIAFAVTPIQIFLIHRIKKISRSRAVFIVLVILSAIEGVLAIAMSASILSKADFGVIEHLVAFADSWMASFAVSDVTISACLIYYLWQNRTGIGQTNHVIARLIREAVECAAFASLFAITILVSFTLWPSTLISAVFLISLSRVYTNTFLAILNSRRSLRRRLYEDSYSENDSYSEDGHDSAVARTEQSGAAGIFPIDTIDPNPGITMTTIGSLQLSSYSAQIVSSSPIRGNLTV